MKSEYAALAFIDARKALAKVFKDTVFPGNAFNAKARRPETKAELEFRQAAIFALGRAALAGIGSIRFAMYPVEADPVDAVLEWPQSSGGVGYEGVSLKELVPEEVRPEEQLFDLAEKVSERFASNRGLTVAIHLNRDTYTQLGSKALSIPSELKFWLVGSAAHPNRGFIVKDPFSKFAVSEFQFPRPPSSLVEAISEWRSPDTC